MLWSGDVLGYVLMEKREGDGTFVLIVVVKASSMDFCLLFGGKGFRLLKCFFLLYI